MVGPPPLPKSQALPPELPAYRPADIIDPARLEQYRNLILFAKTTVEGFLAGRHQSPDFGSSGEFEEYKTYEKGDETRQIDWMRFRKNGELLVKRFLEETDMVSYLLLDASHSMAYQSGNRENKFEQASKLAAALAYLVIRQGDQVSLTLFSEKIRNHLSAGSTQIHFQKLARELVTTRPGEGTDARESLEACVGLFRKKGRIIFISDCLTHPMEILDALSLFRHRGFEVLVLHIMAPDELTLPEVSMARFIDLETNEEISIDPSEIRRDYHQQVSAELNAFSRDLTNRGIQYHFVDSTRSYLDVLEAFLTFSVKQTPARMA